MRYALPNGAGIAFERCQAFDRAGRDHRWLGASSTRGVSRTAWPRYVPPLLTHGISYYAAAGSIVDPCVLRVLRG